MKTVSQILDKAASVRQWSPRMQGELATALLRAHDHELDLRDRAGAARVAEFMTGFGMPEQSPAQLVDRFRGAALHDEGFKAIYKPINLRNGLHWDIYSSTNGLTFQRLEEGGEIRLHSVSAGVQTYRVHYYATAFAVQLPWLENQQWYRIEDAHEQAKAAYHDKQAETFYGLLDAIAADQDQAFVEAGLSTTVEKDVATINAACAAIIESMAALGPEMRYRPGEPFVITAPEALRSRIVAAVNQMALNPAASAAQVEAGGPLLVYRVVPIFTGYLAASDKYYVSLPKRKTQMAIRKELTAQSGDDLLRLAKVETRHAAWGGAIAEESQHRRCAIA